MDIATTPLATEPAQLSASEAAMLIRAKRLSSEELVRSCLARVAARDPVVKAWLSLDPDHAIRQARALDKLTATGASLGPLHGLPFGVKDVIDTQDFPTTQNSLIYDGHAGRARRGVRRHRPRVRRADSG